MQKKLLFAFVLLCATAQAEVITLDLSQPTNEITFDENGLWEQRFEGELNTLDFQIFSFNHYGTVSDWGGYCDIFSISKDAQTDFESYVTDQWRNVVGHGTKGEGSPFLIAYDGGEYNGKNNVTFNDGKAYKPLSVSICQSAYTDEAIQNGLSPARALGTGDFVSITFTGLDAEGKEIEGSEVVYYLFDMQSEDLDNWEYNQDWEEVDLSGLGEVYGIHYKVASSDVGEYGYNTPLYFSMDALAVESVEQTGIETINLQKAAQVSVYTLAGQLLQTVNDKPNNVIRQLPTGSVYILRANNKTIKVVK